MLCANRAEPIGDGVDSLARAVAQAVVANTAEMRGVGSVESGGVGHTAASMEPEVGSDVALVEVAESIAGSGVACKTRAIGNIVGMREAGNTVERGEAGDTAASPEPGVGSDVASAEVAESVAASAVGNTAERGEIESTVESGEIGGTVESEEVENMAASAGPEVGRVVASVGAVGSIAGSEAVCKTRATESTAGRGEVGNTAASAEPEIEMVVASAEAAESTEELEVVCTVMQEGKVGVDSYWEIAADLTADVVLGSAATATVVAGDIPATSSIRLPGKLKVCLEYTKGETGRVFRRRAAYWTREAVAGLAFRSYDTVSAEAGPRVWER